MAEVLEFKKYVRYDTSKHSRYYSVRETCYFCNRSLKINWTALIDKMKWVRCCDDCYLVRCI